MCKTYGWNLFSSGLRNNSTFEKAKQNAVQALPVFLPTKQEPIATKKKKNLGHSFPLHADQTQIEVFHLWLQQACSIVAFIPYTVHKLWSFDMRAKRQSEKRRIWCIREAQRVTLAIGCDVLMRYHHQICVVQQRIGVRPPSCSQRDGGALCKLCPESVQNASPAAVQQWPFSLSVAFPNGHTVL